VQEGWIKALNQASLGWLILMGLLYIIGTMFYALRIPERFFPGKFDIWVRKIYSYTLYRSLHLWWSTNYIVVGLVVSKPPNLPRFRGCRSLRSLSWDFRNGNAQADYR
jgi:predicted membrane channel-forming protein YqfA (hemolysin III family)